MEVIHTVKKCIKGPFYEQPDNGNVADLAVIVLPLNFANGTGHFGTFT